MPLPWTRLATLVPALLGLSRELLDRKRPPDRSVPDLSARLAALEEARRREAELVHSIAVQTAALAQAAASLRRWTIGATVAAGVAVLAAAIALALAAGR